jgi:hypothetical protein
VTCEVPQARERCARNQPRDDVSGQGVKLHVQRYHA